MSMPWFNLKREPLSKPLNKSPPGPEPWHPTLLLGLPRWAANSLNDVLINDLVFSSNGAWKLFDENGIKLHVLQYLDGDSLLNMTQAYGGSVVLSDDQVFAEGTDQVDRRKLQDLSKQRYQAIVIDDTCLYREPDLTEFVSSQYSKGVSVVVMALEGIYNLNVLQQVFGVNWTIRAYTKRTIKLTESGKRIIGTDAFPFETKYTKALYVSGEEELFMEHVSPDDYETSDSEVENDPVPDPAPGCPVVTHIDGVKSVSFFGFVNDLDVSYGAIIHRLCYAAYHNSERTAPFSEQSQETAREPGDLSYWQWYRTMVVRVGESLLQRFGARKAKED